MPGLWSAARPVTALERLRRSAAYFRLSIVRATVRWLKHMVSFEGWLDYIVQKASRHSGQEIRLSERERHRLVFLWGRVFRHIAQARKGERKSGSHRRSWCSRPCSGGRPVDSRVRAPAAREARADA